MKADETDKLIEDLLDCDISDAEFLRLEAAMIVSEEARQAYYDRQKVNTALQLDAESQSGADLPIAVATENSPLRAFKIDWLMTCGLAALVIVVGLIGWKIGQTSGNGKALNEEPVATGFGVVAAQSEAVWKVSELGEDDLLPAGSLGLESGVTQLELFSGVVLLIEGEAEFEVLSPNDLRVVKGRLLVQVPEMEEGFLIRTPSGEVASVRSDFAMEVNGDLTDLYLQQGRIDWRPDSGSGFTMSVPWTMRWDGAAGEAVKDFAYDPAIWIRLDAFEQELTDRQANQLQQWQQQSRKLRTDPRLLAYFPMDQEGDWSREMMDESGSGIQGTIVRASRSMDRWERPYAGLDFSPMGSRVRLSLPGEHQSLTLMCWVKINSLDRLYNSLFLTDGHELHEPHWQLMDDGRLFFSVKARNEKGKPDKHIAYSPPIWTPAQSGQWMHLATVYDGETFTTTHYVNGEAVSIDQIPEEHRPEKVVIGAASIGNWSEPRYRKDAEFAVRNLNGSIDEFALFGAPLGAAEIREIYEVGKP